MAFVCPICNKIINHAPHSGDIVHECYTGDDAIDKESLVEMRKPQWNQQGIINTASPKAQLQGVDDEPVNANGFRASTHYTRRKERYFEVK